MLMAASSRMRPAHRDQEPRANPRTGGTFRLDSRPGTRQRRGVTTNLRGLLKLRPLLLGLATR